MKLKLDLHTHCFEALGICRPSDIDRQAIDKIVASIKQKGLDGIAITEHGGSSISYRAKEMVEHFYGNDVLIIPGEEVWYYPVEVVQLFLPDGSVFRFLAHPGSPADYEWFISSHVDCLHGIELNNNLHNWLINKQKVRNVAEKGDLFLLSNSDAHDLNDLGCYHNEVDLEEMCARSKSCAFTPFPP